MHSDSAVVQCRCIGQCCVDNKLPTRQELALVLLVVWYQCTRIKRLLIDACHCLPIDVTHNSSVLVVTVLCLACSRIGESIPLDALVLTWWLISSVLVLLACGLRQRITEPVDPAKHRLSDTELLTLISMVLAIYRVINYSLYPKVKFILEIYTNNYCSKQL